SSRRSSALALSPADRRTRFFFYCSAAHLDLHSFPTRRSSDLEWRKTFRFARRSLTAMAISARSTVTMRPPCGTRRRSFAPSPWRSEEHTSELQSRENLVCRLLLEKKKINTISLSQRTKQHTLT